MTRSMFLEIYGKAEAKIEKEYLRELRSIDPKDVQTFCAFKKGLIAGELVKSIGMKQFNGDQMRFLSDPLDCDPNSYFKPNSQVKWKNQNVRRVDFEL